MPRLTLESLTDASLNVDLDSIVGTGHGPQAVAGATGLGIPGVTLQWSAGAGDGAVYRSKRVPQRDIDIPIHIFAGDQGDLRKEVSRLARLFATPMRLYFQEDDTGDRWYLDVYRSGGGDYAYGGDTNGDRELNTVITVTAGDPYWTSETFDQRVISRAVTGKGLIKDSTAGNTGADSLIHLRLSSSQVQGTVLLENTGDVASYPVWEIYGPGSDILAIGPNGDKWEWTGSLATGEKLTVDSRAASAIDATGASRYASFALAPRFWTVPPGISTATVTMGGSGRIVVTWKRRKWAMI
jgi:hypothetical protein